MVGLSSPYLGRLEATSSTNLVTRSFCNVSIKRRIAPESAGALFRLAIVQSPSFRPRTVLAWSVDRDPIENVCIDANQVIVAQIGRLRINDLFDLFRKGVNGSTRGEPC